MTFPEPQRSINGGGNTVFPSVVEAVHFAGDPALHAIDTPFNLGQYALRLDGFTHAAEVHWPQARAFVPAHGSSFAVEAWLKFRGAVGSSGTQYLVSSMFSCANDASGTCGVRGLAVYLDLPSQTVRFTTADGVNRCTIASARLPLHDWVHVVAVHDGDGHVNTLHAQARTQASATTVTASCRYAASSVAPFRIGAGNAPVEGRGTTPVTGHLSADVVGFAMYSYPMFPRGRLGFFDDWVATM